MDRKEIIATIRNLATAEGFYRRLYFTLAKMMKETPKKYEKAMRLLEAEHFNDATELVLYFECR